MQVKLPFIATSTCNGAAMYNGAVIDGMFCAGFAAGGKDSCRVIIIIIIIIIIIFIITIKKL